MCHGWYVQVLYMLKDPSRFLTRDNISSVVQFGLVAGVQPMEGLLQLVGKLYLPQVLGSHTWPDTVRRDFLGYTHRFMAHLTEAVHAAKGQTVLYIPSGEVAHGAAATAAAGDKDLTQRLESIVIQWTRQINNMLNERDANTTASSGGPLAELEFWRTRSSDLSSIRKQLEDERVTDICAVLSACGSSYLSPFLKLKDRIQQEAGAAEDTLRFLTCLEQPCQELAAATPEGIPALLPRIFNCIRLVWSLSSSYNTPERILVLLRQLSNEVMERCCAAINLEEVFSGEVAGVMAVLQQSIAAGGWWCCCKQTRPSCVRTAMLLQANLLCPHFTAKPCSPSLNALWLSAGVSTIHKSHEAVPSGLGSKKLTCCCCPWSAGQQWKAQYHMTAAAINRWGPRAWDFDITSLTSYLDAFLQRCTDLLEVCQAQLQFSPSNTVPVFGGTKGAEFEKSIADIQASFQALVEKLKGLTYNILDVKAIRCVPCGWMSMRCLVCVYVMSRKNAPHLPSVDKRSCYHSMLFSWCLHAASCS